MDLIDRIGKALLECEAEQENHWKAFDDAFKVKDFENASYSKGMAVGLGRAMWHIRVELGKHSATRSDDSSETRMVETKGE